MIQELPVFSWSWSKPIRPSPKLFNPWRRTSSNPDPSWALGLSQDAEPGTRVQSVDTVQAFCSAVWVLVVLLLQSRTPNHHLLPTFHHLLPLTFPIPLFKTLASLLFPKELSPLESKSQEGSLPLGKVQNVSRKNSSAPGQGLWHLLSCLLFSPSVFSVTGASALLPNCLQP